MFFWTDSSWASSVSRHPCPAFTRLGHPPSNTSQTASGPLDGVVMAVVEMGPRHFSAWRPSIMCLTQPSVSCTTTRGRGARPGGFSPSLPQLPRIWSFEAGPVHNYAWGVGGECFPTEFIETFASNEQSLAQIFAPPFDECDSRCPTSACIPPIRGNRADQRGRKCGEAAAAPGDGVTFSNG